MRDDEVIQVQLNNHPLAHHKRASRRVTGPETGNNVRLTPEQPTTAPRASGVPCSGAPPPDLPYVQDGPAARPPGPAPVDGLPHLELLLGQSRVRVHGDGPEGRGREAPREGRQQDQRSAVIGSVAVAVFIVAEGHLYYRSLVVSLRPGYNRGY